MIRWSVTLFLTIVAIVSLKAQESELVTDRPDQTESAFVVPTGSIQWETGFLYEKASSYLKSYSYNTSLLRYGAWDVLEFRMGFDYLGIKTGKKGSRSTVNGFGPLSVGLKALLAQEGDGVPQLAFLGSLDIPNTGKEKFQLDNPGADLRLTMEYTLQQNMSVGANLGVAWSGVKGQGDAVGVYTAVIGLGFTERLGGFAELYGFLQKGKDDHRWDTGITYLVTDKFQLDASAGIGLNDISPDFFVSFGFSVRLP